MRAMAESGKARGANFSSAELNQLVASWLHISQDPITGSGQKLVAFWDRTLKHYNDHKPADRENRNVRSLETKWSELKHDVAKFCGCYQSVVNKNISGIGLEEILVKAKELYVVKDPKGKEFMYVDQWHLLKNCSRFAISIDDMNQKAAQKKARKQKGKGRLADKENDNLNVEAIDDPGVGLEEPVSDVQRSGIENDETQHFGEQRPLGNKAAKKLRGDDSATKIMAAAQTDMAAISAKRLRLAEKQDRENLLTLKVADLDPECQEYFRLCRAKELRIAMLKLQREEEEEMRILRGTVRTPLPSATTPIANSDENSPSELGLGSAVTEIGNCDSLPTWE